MGFSDMKLPIQYAMAYPERLPTKWPRLDFFEAGISFFFLGEGQGVRSSFSFLIFEKPDLEMFQNLVLALEVMEKGGNVLCVLNAANEVAVELFLQECIGFLEMSDLVSHCLAMLSHIVKLILKDLEASDVETCWVAYECILAWNS